MRKLLLVVIVACFSAFGIAGGYIFAVAKEASTSPFLQAGNQQEKGIEGVISDFAKLGGYESVAANCNGTSGVRSAISAESKALVDLQHRTSVDSNLLNVAQAILLVRSLDHPATNAGSANETQQQMESLLSSSGWANSSIAHMQEINTELDHDQCRQVTVGGVK